MCIINGSSGKRNQNRKGAQPFCFTEWNARPCFLPARLNHGFQHRTGWQLDEISQKQWTITVPHLGRCFLPWLHSTGYKSSWNVPYQEPLGTEPNSWWAQLKGSLIWAAENGARCLSPVIHLPSLVPLAALPLCHWGIWWEWSQWHHCLTVFWHRWPGLGMNRCQSGSRPKDSVRRRAWSLRFWRPYSQETAGRNAVIHLTTDTGITMWEHDAQPPSNTEFEYPLGSLMQNSCLAPLASRSIFYVNLASTETPPSHSVLTLWA